MSQIVIFCECYVQYQYALQLAMENYQNHSVTIVIPMARNLSYFFYVLNKRIFQGKLNIIYIEPFQSNRMKANGIKRILSILPDIIRERHYLNDVWQKHFTALMGSDVYFFSRGFNGITFYLLKKLIKNNRLIYVSLASLTLSRWCQYTPRNVTEIIRLVIAKLVYGYNITLGQLPYYKGFLFIPDKFMASIDHIMRKPEINEMMNNLDMRRFRVFNIKDYQVMYFDQPLVKVGYVSDIETYKRELNNVFSILGKYVPKSEIAIKYHPEYDDGENLEDIGDVLPYFIPAELLYNDNIKLYLAVMSWSLAHVENGLVVSLADLITFKDDDVRRKLKEEFIGASKTDVIFPQTLDEFEKILIGLR